MAGRAPSPVITAGRNSTPPSPSVSTASTTGSTSTASRCPAAFQSQAVGYFNGIQFVSPERGWVVGQREILATTDGGAHWIALTDPCIRSVHFVSPLTGFAIAGGTGSRSSSPAPADGGRVLATTDGGQSWRAVRAPANAQTVCFDNARQGWLGAAGWLYQSADGGRSWALVTAGAKQLRAGYTATMEVQCAGAGTAWVLDLGPGAEASQQPHIGYYASPAGAAPLFAEQYFPHPGVFVTAESPGSYAGPISAISATAAAFIDFCPACGAGTVPWDLVSGSGRSIIREGTVGGQLTQPESASFLSAHLGWVLGVVTKYGADAWPRQFQRVVSTSDGGRTWQVLYTS